MELKGMLKPHLRLGYRIKYAKNTTLVYEKGLSEIRRLKTHHTEKKQEFLTYATKDDKKHAYILRGLDAGFHVEEITQFLHQKYDIQIADIFLLKNTEMPLCLIIVTVPTQPIL
ncbi:unnamed protein product [Brassicogethes aeneus]|uniref:Uncharacterized protein n=1 Tax=Brassicogethes aeneus TaxID=1431903 RepID=A0A9P0B7I4_BRAAE|nr:unnamed protein product [Brassicogethes aeneus]